MKSGVKGQESVRVPILPFVVQDFDPFVGRLLSRLGYKNILDRGTVLASTQELWDIKDGAVIRELRGLDGKLFMDGLRRRELHLVWSLSVDWFNPQ